MASKGNLCQVLSATELPPGVVGQTRFYVRVIIGKIVWSIQPQPTYKNLSFCIKWWGEKSSGAVIDFDRQEVINAGCKEVVYAVKSGLNGFLHYLHDMEFLLIFMKVDTNLIGSTTISTIKELTASRSITGYFPVISKQQANIAKVYVKVVLDCNKQAVEKLLSISNHSTNNSKKTSRLKTDNEKCSKSVSDDVSSDFVYHLDDTLDDDENVDTRTFIDNIARKTILGDDVSLLGMKSLLALINDTMSSDDDINSLNSENSPVYSNELLNDLFYSNLSPTVDADKVKDVSNEINSSKRLLNLDKDVKVKQPKLLLPSLKDTQFIRITVDNCSLGDDSKLDVDNHETKSVRSSSINPSCYILEYHFPKLPQHKFTSTKDVDMENVRVAGKRLQNNSIVFGHRSVFPVKFSQSTLKFWRNLEVSFHVFLKHHEKIIMIKMAKLPLQSVLTSTSMCTSIWLPLHMLKRSTEAYFINHSFLPDKLKVTVQLASDMRQFYTNIQQAAVANFQRKIVTSNDLKLSLQIAKISGDENEKPIILQKPANLLKNDQRSDQLEITSVDDNQSLVICLIVSHGRDFIPTKNAFDKELGNSAARNLYLECRFFKKYDVERSRICYSSLNPVFMFYHKYVVYLNDSFLNRTKHNYLFIEVWDHMQTNDELVGISELSLHEFYNKYKDHSTWHNIFKEQMPVIPYNDYVPVKNVQSNGTVGKIYVTLAAGTHDQMDFFSDEWKTSSNCTEIVPLRKQPFSLDTLDQKTIANPELLITTECIDELEIASSPEYKHIFTITLKDVCGLMLPQNLLSTNMECFVHYMFPSHVNDNIALKSFCSRSVLCIPNPVFKDTQKHTLTTKSDHDQSIVRIFKQFCSSGILFTIQCRQPTVFKETCIAKGIFPVTRLFSLLNCFKNKKPATINVEVPLKFANSKSNLAGLLKVVVSYSCYKQHLNQKTIEVKSSQESLHGPNELKSFAAQKCNVFKNGPSVKFNDIVELIDCASIKNCENGTSITRSSDITSSDSIVDEMMKILDRCKEKKSHFELGHAVLISREMKDVPTDAYTTISMETLTCGSEQSLLTRKAGSNTSNYADSVCENGSNILGNSDSNSSCKNFSHNILKTSNCFLCMNDFDKGKVHSSSKLRTREGSMSSRCEKLINEDKVDEIFASSIKYPIQSSSSSNNSPNSLTSPPVLKRSSRIAAAIYPQR